jgi:hypothetical protein
VRQRGRDRRPVRGDRREPLAGGPGLDAQEQQQRKQEHEVGGQPGHAGEQPADQSGQLAEIQRARCLSQLFRTDPELRELGGERGDQAVGLRRVEGELCPQLSDGQDDAE